MDTVVADFTHPLPIEPWPVSYAGWVELGERVGLRETRMIGEMPSRFLGSIYAAASRPDG